MRSVRIATVAAAVLTLSGAWSIAIADQIVYFSNGKAMTVKKVEQGDGVTILELEGGGRLGVPTEAILRIEEYGISQPNVGRPPAAQQTRTATRTPPPTPGTAGAAVSATTAADGGPLNEADNLIADAPSVVPDPTGDTAVGLAAPREQALGAGGPQERREVAAAAAGNRDAGQDSPADAAAALAAQQSMAAKMEQRQRSGQLGSPRGRTRSSDMARGQALMGAQTPRRPGRGAAQAGATDPAAGTTAPAAGAQSEEEIIPDGPGRRGGRRGGASGETAPPPEDGETEQPPSGAN